MSLVWGLLFTTMSMQLALVTMLLVPMPDKLRKLLARGLRTIGRIKYVKFVAPQPHSQTRKRTTRGWTNRIVAGAAIAFIVIMFIEATSDVASASVCSTLPCRHKHKL